MITISVLVPSYNHARYIKETIFSILSQTYSNIEIIIVDDASTDGSDEIIKGIDDPRIRHIQLDENVGACEAMNIGIQQCRGRYIAVCNSDDIWVANKLERQLAVIESLPGVAAVFSDVEWIDDTGHLLTGERLPFFSETFNQVNRSRYAWIRRLIEEGNCLCHPSVLIRADVYKEIGYYNNYLRQLPDLDMWIRVLLKYDIFVMRDRLVKFRLHLLNTSAQNPGNKTRTWNEHILILKTFFDNIPSIDFYEIFGFENIKSIKNANDIFLYNKEKVSYFLQSDSAFSSIFREMALKIIFSDSLSGNEVIDAHFFHKLSELENGRRIESEVNPLPPVEKIKPLKRMLGKDLYHKVSGINKKRKSYFRKVKN